MKKRNTKNPNLIQKKLHLTNVREGSWNFPVMGLNLPVTNQPKHHIEKNKYSSESSDSNKKKNMYKPYEEISGEFKNIKPPMFNGETKKGEEA